MCDPFEQSFGPQLRIRRHADFQRVFRRRASASDGNLLVYGCPNGLDFARLGLSVSRKVGGAVARNRWKRLLREAFRLRQRELPAGVDLVVVPRAEVRPQLGPVSDSLQQLARRVARRLTGGNSREPAPSGPERTGPCR